LALSEAEEYAITKKGRRPKVGQPKPIAPFDKDVSRASRNAFDRETGGSVLASELKTYRQALVQYHLSPESKFLNGDFADRGRTERRHVQVTSIVHIGKEADKWEEQFFLGLDEDAQIEYGVDEGGSSLDERVRRMCDDFGKRGTARRLGVSRMTLSKALAKGSRSLRNPLRNRVAKRVNNELRELIEHSAARNLT
jgi:hypothetical protein